MGNFGKDLLLFIGGAAIGALAGTLYAPAKGAATRRKLASSTRNLRNTVVDKLEDMMDSAEELIDDLKVNTTDLITRGSKKVETVLTEKKK